MDIIFEILYASAIIPASLSIYWSYCAYSNDCDKESYFISEVFPTTFYALAECIQNNVNSSSSISIKYLECRNITATSIHGIVDQQILLNLLIVSCVTTFLVGCSVVYKLFSLNN